MSEKRRGGIIVEFFRVEYIAVMPNRCKKTITEIVSSTSLENAWKEACKKYPRNPIKTVAKITREFLKHGNIVSPRCK